MRNLTKTRMDHVLRKATSLQALGTELGDMLENGDRLYEIRKAWVSENYYLPDAGKSVSEKLLDEMEREIFSM